MIYPAFFINAELLFYKQHSAHRYLNGADSLSAEYAALQFFAGAADNLVLFAGAVLNIDCVFARCVDGNCVPLYVFNHRFVVERYNCALVKVSSND